MNKDNSRIYLDGIFIYTPLCNPIPSEILTLFTTPKQVEKNVKFNIIPYNDLSNNKNEKVFACYKSLEKGDVFAYSENEEDIKILYSSQSSIEKTTQAIKNIRFKFWTGKRWRNFDINQTDVPHLIKGIYSYEEEIYEEYKRLHKNINDRDIIQILLDIIKDE